MGAWGDRAEDVHATRLSVAHAGTAIKATRRATEQYATMPHGNAGKSAHLENLLQQEAAIDDPSEDRPLCHSRRRSQPTVLSRVSPAIAFPLPFPPADAAVATCGLTRAFGQKVAVNGLNLAVRRGEFFGFLGPNGAGKSTTIKMLVGLLRPSAGAAYIGGVEVWKRPAGGQGADGRPAGASSTSTSG